MSGDYETYLETIIENQESLIETIDLRNLFQSVLQK